MHVSDAWQREECGIDRLRRIVGPQHATPIRWLLGQNPERPHVPLRLQPLTILALCEMDGPRHWTPHGICARGRHHRGVAHHWTSVWIQRYLATGHQYWYYHRDLLDG